MRLRTTRRVGNSHGPIKTVAALVAAMFASTTAPAFDWSANDLSTQYQDSGGTLPVTNVEQPVGLVLDRSKGGAVRGRELVTNSDFQAGTAGWSAASTATLSTQNRRLIITAGSGAGGSSATQQVTGLVVGRIYEFSVEAYPGTAVSRFYAGTTSSLANYVPAVAGGAARYRSIFIATTTSAWIVLQTDTTVVAGSTASFGNVSIREITGPNLWSGTPTVKDANWTDNGDGSFTSNGGTGLLGWPVSTKGIVAGRTYECIVRVTARTAGQLTLPYDGAGSNNTNAVTSVGTFRRIFTAATTALYIYGLNFAGTVDSIYIAEIPGIHRIQPTSASRPTLTARTNYVLNSSFSGGGSVPTSWAATLGTTTSAVQGTVDGNTIYRQTCTVNTDRPFFSQQIALAASLTYVFTARVDTVYSGAPTLFNLIAVQNLPAGATQSYILNGAPAAAGAAVSSGDVIGVVIVVSTTAGTASFRVGIGTNVGTLADVAFSRPSLEFGATPGRFQRNTTATDYDTVGFAKGWRYDGVDDGWYSTASLDFTSTDKVSVVTTLRKLSDAATAIVLELSPNFTTNNGTFFVAAPNGGTSFSFASKGTTQAVNAPTGYPAPYQAIVTGQADIGAATSSLRVNGSVAASTATSMGTGNFGSYLAYFGRRNNNALPLNAIEYSMRLFGRRMSPDELGWLEAQAKLDMNNNL